MADDKTEALEHLASVTKTVTETFTRMLEVGFTEDQVVAIHNLALAVAGRLIIDGNIDRAQAIEIAQKHPPSSS
jgi:hypothetical protein